ncbi:helix-turn-helix domain-containing protein [Candidatus Peregrinibacteria bacterium]|nr:MAG: helix-turn-helix domain-containing protein [Candidatus Peregrinibacteria bacterium]
MTDKTDELITIKELMDMLKISRPTAYRYIERKIFEVYKIEGTLRIRKQSVLDYLSQHKL